ncbi:MAG TPA: amino acid adenylation domain-containing protein [Opitutaceae bacterium]|nr:amino acid adenylation domain-containing protein [Opitutaceae bacterium]
MSPETIALLDACAARGIALEPAPGGGLKVRAPAGALTSELQAALRAHKVELAALLGARAAAPIPRAPRAGPLPLSSAQGRLWFLIELDPQSSAAYHIVVVVRIRGPLRPEMLEGALNGLIERHEILRTGFAAANGRAEQRIAPRARAPFHVLPAAPPDTPAGRAEIREKVRAESLHPFDLAVPPLLRGTLLRASPEDAVFVLTLHHLISDGWSSGVIIRDLAALYEAGAAGRPPALPPLEIQYADYAAWQARRLAGPAAAASLRRRIEALAGVPVLNLPTDRPRPAAMSYRGATAFHTFPPELAAALRQLARAEQATLFQVLLAGFYALLHRLTGQEDLAVGTSIANRADPALEPLIGFLTNTVVLRARPRGSQPYRELLAEVRAAAEAAYEDGETPLEQVIEALRPERTLSQNPLFQTCFSLLQAHRDALRISSLELEQWDPENATARFDLTVTCEDARAGLIVAFEYSTDLFDAATIGRLAGWYRLVLEEAAARPATPLARLPLLRPAEAQAILRGWNDSATPYPRARCVHELFEEWVRRDPAAPAVTAAGRTLRYGELNAAANRLARRLRSRGIGPDAAVAVCAERTLEMIVALVAVLKAGGCYLPFDPADPPERLAFLFAQAGAKLMLAPAEAGPRLPQAAGAAWLPVRLDNPELRGEDPADLPALTRPDHLAYITFTSGSTGRPKGICIPHRGVVRLVRDTNYLPYGPELRILELAPVSFDASTFELWGALGNGAELCLLRPGPPTIGDLAEAIQGHRITSLYLTSALFNLMVDERPEAFAGVRHLLVGGDALSPPHVRAILAAHPGLTVINGYGPTETTTFASCGLLRRPEEVGSNVTIGPPLSNTTLYILDSELQAVPPGVPGDLYIGGDGNARGYLGQPELTAESFVPNPHPAAPGERIYRTGDLARWRPDGTAEFLGRRDFQVKIRGFRVELGEIESVLASHPAVQEAIVLALEEPAGKRLLACLQLRPGQGPAEDEGLRAHLRTRLPEFMVPAAFVRFESFPLTAHQKVDRAALRARAAGAAAARPAYQAPRTPLEAVLAGIWAEVLRVPQVGAADNFFDRGGHSLLATQLAWRISEVFRCAVPLRLLFDAPVLGDFTQALRELADRAGGKPGRAEAIARVHQQVAALSDAEVAERLRSSKSPSSGP